MTLMLFRLETKLEIFTPYAISNGPLPYVREEMILNLSQNLLSPISLLAFKYLQSLIKIEAVFRIERLAKNHTQKHGTIYSRAFWFSGAASWF